MADVRLVCVREDMARGQALGEMLARAGFSVGGPPADGAALAASCAGIVVWSQAGMSSRLFLDAGQQIVDAGKAVFANLAAAPPKECIRYAPSFDLSAWDGSADAAVLDPLLYEIDRMVTLCRSSAAYAVDPLGWMLAPGSSRRRARAPRRDAREEKPEDFGDQVEGWLAIAESSSSGNFEKYLARHGSRGLFSGLAEERLRALGDVSSPARPSRPVEVERAAPASVINAQSAPVRTVPRKSAMASARQRKPMPVAALLSAGALAFLIGIAAFDSARSAQMLATSALAEEEIGTPQLGNRLIDALVLSPEDASGAESAERAPAVVKASQRRAQPFVEDGPVRIVAAPDAVPASTLGVSGVSYVPDAAPLQSFDLAKPLHEMDAALLSDAVAITTTPLQEASYNASLSGAPLLPQY